MIMKGIFEIARYTSSCRGCARSKKRPGILIALKQGEFEQLQAEGVPEVSMDVFDEIHMEEMKQLDIEYREMLKGELS